VSNDFKMCHNLNIWEHKTNESVSCSALTFVSFKRLKYKDSCKR